MRSNRDGRKRLNPNPDSAARVEEFREVWDAEGRVRTIVDSRGARTTFTYELESDTRMRHRGGILTRFEARVRRCASTSPNRSLAAIGFLLLPSPFYLFIFGCVLYDLESVLPAAKSLFNSRLFNLFGAVMMVLGIMGPIGGVALIVFSACRAYLDYRRREPAFRRSYVPPESK